MNDKLPVSRWQRDLTDLLRVDIRFATFIASNDHAIGTPCCALLPLCRAANETEDVGAGAHQGTPVPRCLRQASNQAPSSLPVPRLRGRG